MPMNKEKIINEKINTEIQMEQEHKYMEIVRAICRAKDNLGYLSNKQIAKAIKRGIREDLTDLIKELKQYEQL